MKINITDGVTYEIIAREDMWCQEGTLHYKKGEVVDTITTTKTKLLYQSYCL